MQRNHPHHLQVHSVMALDSLKVCVQLSPPSTHRTLSLSYIGTVVLKQLSPSSSLQSPVTTTLLSIFGDTVKVSAVESPALACAVVQESFSTPNSSDI